jgi:hypothetical protein
LKTKRAQQQYISRSAHALCRNLGGMCKTGWLLYSAAF